MCHHKVSPQAAFIEERMPSLVALVFMFWRGVKLGHLSGGGGQARKETEGSYRVLVLTNTAAFLLHKNVHG